MPLEFIKPDQSMEKEILAFRDSFYAAGEQVINGSGGLDFFPDFDTWLQNIAGVEDGSLPGLVPTARIRLARDTESGQLAGIIDIRPGLPGDKAHYGHLGYATSPLCRGRGVATQMVCWGVEQLRAQGVGDILASVYADNTASIRVLEKCGFLQKGIYKDEETDNDVIQYINVKSK